MSDTSPHSVSSLLFFQPTILIQKKTDMTCLSEVKNKTINMQE